MANQTLKNAHGGFAGPSLQDKIRKLMDKQLKRVKALQDKKIDNYNPTDVQEVRYNILINQGRLEGMAATLAILRSTSIDEELELTRDRVNAAEKRAQ